MPDHPAARVPIEARRLFDGCQGRYQLLAVFRRLQGNASVFLTSRQRESQDAIALEQLKECGAALTMIDMGNLAAAIGLCAHIWASLPGAGYRQPESEFAALLGAYEASGGTFTA